MKRLFCEFDVDDAIDTVVPFGQNAQLISIALEIKWAQNAARTRKKPSPHGAVNGRHPVSPFVTKYSGFIA
jgi:hypothetical protein